MLINRDSGDGRGVRNREVETVAAERENEREKRRENEREADRRRSQYQGQTAVGSLHPAFYALSACSRGEPGLPAAP